MNFKSGAGRVSLNIKKFAERETIDMKKKMGMDFINQVENN